MKVYIITKGAYSDYHICAVATDKKKAEILKKAFDDKDGWREARIETYETDEFITEIESGLKLYNCSMKYGDLSVSVWLEDLDYIGSSDFKVRKYKERFNTSTYAVYVWAKDEDHARKIAVDKIAEYKAKEAGI